VPLGSAPALITQIERSEAKGPLGERDIAALNSLLPHLRRACQLRLRMHDYQAAAQAERDALDALSTGIVTFDSAHRVLVANAAARAQAENLPLRFAAGTEMSGPPVVIKAFRKLIDDAVRGGAGGTTCLSRADGGNVGVTVAPVRSGALDHLSHYPAGRPAAMALLVDVSRSHEAASALLAARHDLTAAELRVATELGRTNGMAAAAATTSASSTTKGQRRRRLGGASA